MNLISIVVLSIAIVLLPKPRTGIVTKIVDGDTIIVDVEGIGDMVRLIGIDTPELKNPEKPVEHFAKETSEYTKRTLLGKTVRLEFDQANNHIRHRDIYGRLLAYVYLDGECFNAKIIRDGYAFAYTKYPFDDAKMEEFRNLERLARTKGFGLWGPEDVQQRAPPAAIVPATTSEIVYITKTGKKYHRGGCKYLKKSKIAITKDEAKAKGYGPCSICGP